MNKFITLFNKVGGWGILGQYRRGHVLLFALIQTALQGFSKKSLEIVRLSVNNRILGRLRRKYRSFISNFKQSAPSLPRERSDKVWVCWFQGVDNAPPLVQQCVHSLRKHLPDQEIVVLTEENYRDYVTLPDYIINKAEAGTIPKAHFSDLLRLALLIKYGGTWIDATVYCSGSNIPEYMLDSDLFMFQMLKPGLDGHCAGVSNWFITACTNHPLLLLTQALLYDYWAKHDKLLDYFIFHDFFQLAIEAYPEEWAKVVPFSNSVPHILLLRLFEPFCQTTWKALQDMTPFHKLTYKFSNEQAQMKNTYYATLFTSEN